MNLKLNKLNFLLYQLCEEGLPVEQVFDTKVAIIPTE